MRGLSKVGGLNKSPRINLAINKKGVEIDKITSSIPALFIVILIMGVFIVLTAGAVIVKAPNSLSAASDLRSGGMDLAKTAVEWRGERITFLDAFLDYAGNKTAYDSEKGGEKYSKFFSDTAFEILKSRGLKFGYEDQFKIILIAGETGKLETTSVYAIIFEEKDDSGKVTGYGGPSGVSTGSAVSTKYVSAAGDISPITINGQKMTLVVYYGCLLSDTGVCVKSISDTSQTSK